MSLPALPYPADGRPLPPDLYDVGEEGEAAGIIIYPTADPIPAPADDDSNYQTEPGPPSSLLPPPPSE